ncbi:two-component system sensor histidine kinase NtrB [Sporosarcina limicola]|uniref:histidine kinase n=1 Tax=Sporosarcina limicola TaxID=34101 RepID=A0A927MTF3_9BACL|nr:ATP-binding protein [Sporosarcina limicola]MBE1557064.1 PAS domain S-box-containing protein [Sporosarcina limicola]
MGQLRAIHSRNIFIILCLISTVILHLVILPVLNNRNETISAIFGLMYSIVLIILYRRRLNPIVLRNLILIGCNSYVFFMNLLGPYQANLLYLFFPILLTAVYHVIWLNVLIISSTGMEVAILFYFFSPNYLSVTQPSLLFDFAIIFIIVIILCILYLLKIGTEWKSIFSENKRMDAILTSKEGYLDLFFEHAQDAIAVFGLDNKIITVNPAFEAMYGWKIEECIGQSLRFYPSSEDEVIADRIRKVLEGKSYHLLRTKEMRKDGDVFDAELTIAPIYDSEDDVIAISLIARDITLKLKADILKIDAEKLLAIGEIAASVAHEVRNPLTAISGFIQMMNNDPTNPYHAYTEIMDSEINRIDLIVSEFLVLSKPSLKKSTEFYIENTIQDVIAMFKPNFLNSSIVCDVQFHEDSTMIPGNEDGMKQVFINLLKNSCEALKKNGIITIKVTYQQETVSISIRDNGPGMDTETIGNLYEPFFTTKEGGTGLGMLISKKIILDQNGTITVTSKKNKGTKTLIKLPLTPVKKTASING